MSQPSLCLIATVKDEAISLLEWLAHNMAIGFNRILIASNDCTDGTDLMLNRLQDLGLITHVPNPAPHRLHRSIQHTAYARLRQLEAVKTADWLMALDVDEFLNIHIGQGTIPELLAQHAPNIDGIVFTWRNFGDAGRSGLPSAPVTEVYTMAISAEAVAQTPNFGQSKQLYRHHKSFAFLSAHGGGLVPGTNMMSKRGVLVTPAGRTVDPAVWADCPVPFHACLPAPEWSVAQINHYLTKTRGQMHLRHARGDAHHADKYDQRYFSKHNRNDEPDVTIQRSKPLRDAQVARLMADPVLSDMHNAAVRAARAQIRAFRQRRRAPSPKGA